MTASLDESVQELCTISTEVNTLTDRVNRKVQSIQTHLSTAGVATDLWLPGWITESGALFSELGSNEPAFQLGWGNEGKGWGFYCRFSYDSSEELATPLLGTARWVRIAAFAHVERLVQDLLTAVSAQKALLDRVRDLVPDNDAHESVELPGGSDPFAPPADDDIPF